MQYCKHTKTIAGSDRVWLKHENVHLSVGEEIIARTSVDFPGGGWQR